MCWAQKCCYVIPANIGCVLMGICSFLVSLFMLSGCIAYFIIEDEGNRQLATSHDQYVKTLGLQLSMTSVRILMAIAIIIAVLGMMFSAMLVVGITKNKPSFVLCYFAFGIIITIVGQLSALLVLLENCWILALVLFIVSLIHIHFMVVVHTVYELMLRGKDFRFHQQADDVDPLADCFDEDIERI
uniref:Uncharacterized protein n=1 Tax=Heliothis virescens TaxID=7102 RepID=A0A2A4J0Y8_HELVI